MVRPPLVLLLLLLLAVLSPACLTPPESDSPVAERTAWRLECSPRDDDVSWPQECVVRASRSDHTKAELWVAINPTNPANVVLGAKDMNPSLSRSCTWNRLAVTHDGGDTWTEVSIGGTLADREPTNPYYPWACNTDPMFVFDPDGILYSVLELYALGTGPNTAGQGSPTNFANAGVAFFLATSRDGGLTWSDPRELLTLPGLPVAPDHPWLVRNPRTGTLHIALIDYLVGHRCYVLNVRGEASPELILVPTPGDRGCSQAAVLADGTLIVAGHEPAVASADTVQGETRRTWFAQSTDDGRTFTEPTSGFEYEPLAGRFEESQHEANSILRIEGDPAREGTLYAVYDALDGTDGQVLFRSSKDAGRTWSEPIDLAADASRHHQFMPGLSISDDGALHAFFLDKRYDPANARIGVTYARSEDGGATWTHAPVTTVSWDGDLSLHQYGHEWVGDYIGVDSVGDHVWGAFPDASLGTAPSMAATHALRR